MLVGSIGLFTGGTATLCSAQATQFPPIRSEPREVVLPVFVVQEREDPKGLLLGPNGEHLHVWIHHVQEVTGLSAKSLAVFEDGVEQRIQHFSVEPQGVWHVKDNIGEHAEDSWTPSGIWSSTDLRRTPECPGTWYWRAFHTYLITYVPPRSPAGSCHRIEVKVAKKHSRVFAPDQYCNQKDPLSDPLNGTPVGNKLLEYANSGGANSIPLAAQLSAFPGNFGRARVDVSAEIPPNLLKHEWKGTQFLISVALLGLVYDKDHVLSARFSDTLCPPPECEGRYDGPIPPSNVSVPAITNAEKCLEPLEVPRSYRTQLELEPGDYQLELVITDGEKFGRAEASVSVDDFRKSELAISGIALGKRYHTPPADERGPTRAPQYVPLIFDGQEFTPAGDTRFKSGEPLMAYLEIYNNPRTDTASPPKIQLEMKVSDSRTGELKVDTGLRPVESATSSANSVIPTVWTLAVEKLPPGTYRLEAQASDSAGHKTGWRETSFTVE